MKNTYQIVVLGPGGVGKTKGTNALMLILKSLGFRTSEVKPWTEEMVTTSNYVIHNFTIPAHYFDGIVEDLNIVIYDMGGQFKYREMWELHADETDALVAVVDMTRKTTLKQIPLMLPNELMINIPVRLIVNKADLYTEFSKNIENIANTIDATLQQTRTLGMVDYSVKYKGEEKFIFNSKVYYYGDQIPVMRPLENDVHGNTNIRIGDLEAILAKAFKISLPKITEHNTYLFGREFTLHAFDAIYRKLGYSESMLDDELIEMAHTEAPPFISWGDDPDIMIPLNEITSEIIFEGVKSMLIDEEELWKMVQRLDTLGFNIDVEDENSWALTSALLMQENPHVNYKPMHKAVMPPYFIKKMISYNKQKEREAEENYFV